jgi:formiminotetrahydrofolate cyclodeaminase
VSHADPPADRRLVQLSVADFVAAVASVEQPVPAAGSVAALSGAASAALLVLVCEVLEHHRPGAGAGQRQRAQALQLRLLELVDTDAAAFQTFLASPRGSHARRVAAARVAEVPLEIARACGDVVQLGQSLDKDVTGATRLDLGAAHHMARAAMQSALDIADYNLSMVPDNAAKQAIQTGVNQVRARLT